ncbi:MAG: ATP-binding protein [Nannocystaceae bacterium]
MVFHRAGDASNEVAALRRRIAALEAEAQALADANAVAAELMADLEESRAVESALRRRAEELGVQRVIDQLLVESRDVDTLAMSLLRTLVAAEPLELRGEALLVLREGDALRELAAAGDPAGLRERLPRAARTLDGDAPGEWSEEGHVDVALRSGAERLGLLCLRGRRGLAWRDRWLGLLLSVGAQVGVAIERLQVAAHNQRLIRELAEARDRALAATQAKDRFLATMSHELRTPLNAIIGYGELLLDEAREEALAADLQRIVGSGKHLLYLVSDVLDLAKIEAGKVELCSDRFAVAALVHEVAEMILPMVEASRSALEVEIDDAAGELFADLGKVRQVLLNLLSNAAKFTQRGTVRLVAAPAPCEGRDFVSFTITDTGIGMSEAQLARVFEPFVQADATTTRRYGGTGLGLAIAGNYVHLMGGTIVVDSTPGEGTTFEVLLPRSRAPVAPRQGPSQT